MLRKHFFVSKSVNKLTPSVFNIWFSFSAYHHNDEASSFREGNLIKCFCRTNRNEKYSKITVAVDSRNKIQKQIKNTLLKDLSLNNIKTVISNFYLKSY